MGIITDRLLEAAEGDDEVCGEEECDGFCCNAATRGLFSAAVVPCRVICGDEELKCEGDGEGAWARE